MQILKEFVMRRSSIPLVRENIARSFSQSPNAKSWHELLDLSSFREDPIYYRDILRGLKEGLKGRRQVPMPEGWKKAYPALVESHLAEVRDLAITLATQFGDKRAFETLGKIVTDRKEPAANRQNALSTLLFQQKADMVLVLQDLLGDSALRDSAIKGLARFDDTKTPELILKRYATLTDEEKSDAVHTLTSRQSYTKALLDAMEKKQVPIKDVSAFSARQIQALGNKELTETLAKVWGAIRPASEEKAALMKKFKSAMTPEYLKKANLSRGRLVYQKTCAACHRLFGEGGEIGPDLTGSQRMNLDYLLENMLDPSAIVAKDYQVTVLATTSGRIITGIIKGENDKAVTVQTQNELIVLPREDIESRKKSPLSMMPEGQLDPMTLTEVRDLIGYLASPMQVPVAATKK
jgi:putative heme-binding domain-containing protein